MACRDIPKAEQVVVELRKKCGKGEMIVMSLDLSSLQSVREFATEINSKFQKIDILINNAGLGNAPGVRKLTKDGFEEQFGVNHLGHFLLTNLLLDKLKEAENSRIINVGSGAHVMGKLNFDDIMHEKSSPSVPPFPVKAILAQFYCNSKLANSLFNVELAKRLQGSGVHTYCLCPGFVSTDIGKGNKTGFTKYAYQTMRYFSKTAQEGAATTIHCALSKHVANHSGEMYKNCEFWDPRRRPQLSEQDAAKLWKIRAKLVGLGKA